MTKKERDKIIRKAFPPGSPVAVIMEELRIQFKAFGKRQDLFDTRLENLEKRVGNLEVEVMGLRDQMWRFAEGQDVIMKELKEIKLALNNKVNKENFNKLERRVTKLEQVVY